MTKHTSVTSGTGPLLSAALATGLVASAGLIGNLATLPNIPVWYATLAKPSFTPPNSLFGPVWTILYVMMAWAFYRILRLPSSERRRSAIIAFVGQMALNALWSVVFFGLHSPPVGFLVIAALWSAILVTLLRFVAIDRIAGLALTPYLAWVTFAAVLNAAIWRLNG